MGRTSEREQKTDYNGLEMATPANPTNVQTKWAATAFIVESSLVAALAYVPAYFLGGQNPITMLLMTMVFAVIANLKPQSAFA